MTDLPPPVEPNPPAPGPVPFDLDDLLSRVSPRARLEFQNAALTVELERAHARIAELEQG